MEDESKELLTERVLIPMSKSMVEDVQNYRFAHRLSSRAVALREMIQFAIDADKSRKPKK